MNDIILGIDVLGAAATAFIPRRKVTPTTQQKTAYVPPRTTQTPPPPKPPITLQPGAFQTFKAAMAQAAEPVPAAMDFESGGGGGESAFDDVMPEGGDDAMPEGDEAAEAGEDFYGPTDDLDLDVVPDPPDTDPWSIYANEQGFVGDEIEYPMDSEDLLGDATEVHAQRIAELTRQMNAVQNPTVAQARVLLSGAQQAIQTAMAKGSAERTKQRDDAKGHLQWHADALAKLKPAALYSHAADLRKWTIESFIESHLADEAATWRTFGWMLDEIQRGTADIAARAGDVAQKPFRAAEWIANIPWWGWAIGVTVLGYAGYRILLAAAPGAAPYVARRYLR